MRGSKEGIREIQSPLGDGNVHEFTHNFVGAQIREIQSPLGDGNNARVAVKCLEKIREIQSPLGDGNVCH